MIVALKLKYNNTLQVLHLSSDIFVVLTLKFYILSFIFCGQTVEVECKIKNVNP
jgi:hypothetical protein